MKLLTYFIVLVIVTSCRSLDERNEECVMSMPFQVQEHVRSFIEEGEKRGVKVKLKNLRIFLVKSQIKSVNGNRSNAQTNTLTRTIKIDITTDKWSKHPKEIIFHELGHALLNKDHIDDKENIMHKNGVTTITPEMLDALFN